MLCLTPACAARFITHSKFFSSKKSESSFRLHKSIFLNSKLSFENLFFEEVRISNLFSLVSYHNNH